MSVHSPTVTTRSFKPFVHNTTGTLSAHQLYSPSVRSPASLPAPLSRRGTLSSLFLLLLLLYFFFSLLDNLKVALLSRALEWGAAPAGDRVNVSARLQQQLDDLQMARVAACMHGTVPSLVGLSMRPSRKEKKCENWLENS